MDLVHEGAVPRCDPNWDYDMPNEKSINLFCERNQLLLRFECQLLAPCLPRTSISKCDWRQ